MTFVSNSAHEATGSARVTPIASAAKRALHVLLAMVLIVMAAAPAAVAVEPDEKLADPKLEARARKLSTELRCLVCQNQSIDDSNAELAKDLRVLVRERIKAGDSDKQVLNFVVARYGEFVLLRPPFNVRTLLLWLAPFLVLLGALWYAYTAWQRQRIAGAATPAAEKALTADERAELERILKDV